MTCRACGGPTREVLDLGTQPLANSLLESPDAMEQRYPLTLVVCPACRLLQTSLDVRPEEMFNASYPYFSGQSAEWVRHCREFASSITKRLSLTAKSLVVEIGGNDGTLLKEFRCQRLNVEPSASVAEASRRAGIETVEALWENLDLDYSADLIVGNNVLAHTPHLNRFVRRVGQALSPNGMATFEFPWVVNLLRECQFDTIYHEHYSYLSLTALIPLFRNHGLTVFEAEKIPTHGGSLRIYLCRQPKAAYLAPFLEAEACLADEQTYQAFRERALTIRDAVSQFAWTHKPLYAYGAAAKGNTLLNWCGLTSDDILAIGDTTPAKQGKYLPGSRIPIVSEAELIALEPPTVLVLPWNWRSEIVAKLAPRLPNTRFVTPQEIAEARVLEAA